MYHHPGFKLSLLKSLLTGFGSADEKFATIDKLRMCVCRSNVVVEKIAVQDIANWRFSSSSGVLQHVSGRFFSVEGVRATTNFGSVSTWDQPIINQSEIGILGLLVRVNNGVCEFLLQAKIEPGNVNGAQFSPTIQATRSNFQQVHRGKLPPYLNYFLNANPENILNDQLQSEQGGRFFKKRNRNIIVLVDESIHVENHFVWLTLGKIKSLLKENNIVNMDTRSVISTIDYFPSPTEIGADSASKMLDIFSSNPFFSSGLCDSFSIHTLSHIHHFMAKLKFNTEISVDKVSLKELNDWDFTGNVISRPDNRYFKVIGVNVCIENREINNWQQPMVQPSGVGIVALIATEVEQVVHFLIQAKFEIGNFDMFEFGPTVQTTPTDSNEGQVVPFLSEVINTPAENVLFDTILSEEGGRFYQEENRYMIVLDRNLSVSNIKGPFIWMTLNQLVRFSQHNNCLNMQLRSLISAFSPR